MRHAVSLVPRPLFCADSNLQQSRKRQPSPLRPFARDSRVKAKEWEHLGETDSFVKVSVPSCDSCESLNWTQFSQQFECRFSNARLRVQCS